MSATVWRSARLIYRAPDASDEDFLYQMSQDSESFTQATPFLPKPPSQDAAKESRDWISKCFLGVLICLPMTKPAAAVDSKDDAVVNEEQNTKKQEKEKAAAKPKPVGFVVLMQPNPQLAHHRHAEIGITLDSEYHGKGYGSEAIEWILNWGFRFGALHRITIRAIGFNERAIRLYRRLGFVDEGVMREHLWFDGSFRDEIHLAMLEDEWRALQDKKKLSIS